MSITACGGDSALTPQKTAHKGPAIEKSSSQQEAFRGFRAFLKDSRIVYEQGGESLAEEVSKYLDSKSELIERRQYSTFSKPISIYILTSELSAQRYCATRNVRGCVVNQRLYISSRAKSTLAGLMQHELSHLHFEQKLGMLRYHSQIPSWFQEGLAVFVSDGAGSEKVPFSKAINALRSNKAIIPNAKRSLLRPKRAAEFGLQNSMFYAQSGIFVKYLHELNAPAFKQFVLQLSSGQHFATSLSKAYKKDLESLWGGFQSEINGKTLDELKQYQLK